MPYHRDQALAALRAQPLIDQQFVYQSAGVTCRCPVGALLAGAGVPDEQLRMYNTEHHAYWPEMAKIIREFYQFDRLMSGQVHILAKQSDMVRPDQREAVVMELLDSIGG